MKKFILGTFLFSISLILSAQPVGYYNGTAGLKGAELKAKLNEIIGNHIDFSYSQAKYLINYTDSDPNNESNVILFYTQRSQDADTYGTGGDYINREHVWAKSHGDFADIRPMDGDINNLRPADGSVNVNRSNLDFGKVKPDGTQHAEATECWYNSNYWEPGDATKGQVARILMYMATRYEGENGELDLEVVNGFGTYPAAKHGDLEALIEWNSQFPPSDFERRRADRIYSIQQNRNPFVDHPEFVDLIWGDTEPNSIAFDNFSMSPTVPNIGVSSTIRFEIASASALDELIVYYGTEFDSEAFSITLTTNGGNKSFEIPASVYTEMSTIYYKVVAKSGETEETSRGSFKIPKRIEPSDLTKITDLQGTGDASPMDKQVVPVAGRIVSVLDNTIYIQSPEKAYSGVCVYGSLEVGQLGDSVVVTGKVTEYQNLTEITNLSYLYNFKDNQPVDPIEISVSDISEKYEGMLVKVLNVTFADAGTVIPYESGASYTFSDGTASAVVYSRYNSRLGGKTIPEGVFNLVGVVSQYQGTYQILMHDISGLTLGVDNDVPVANSITVTDRNYMEVIFNENVTVESANNIANYSISDDIVITRAYRYSDGKRVILQVENMSLGDHTITIHGVEDLYGNAMQNVVYEFNSTFTRVDDLKKSTLQIYPNPSLNGEIVLKSSTQIRQISVVGLNGMLLYQKNCNAFEVPLNLGLSKGVYWLKSTNVRGEKTINQLIIK